MSESLSKTQVIRDLRQEIERAQHVASIPVVLWARLEETPESFALRCAGLQLNGVDRLIAVVPHGFAKPAGVQVVEFSPKLFWLLHPSASSRYRAASGGRGSGRSRGITQFIVLECLRQFSRWLYAREIQRSIKESGHHSISNAIDELGLSEFFEIRNTEIVCVNGSEVIFSGLWQNSTQLKSMEGITRCFVEEAQNLSADSKAVLTPTIREPGSEIIFSWNPDQADAPIEEFASGNRTDTRYAHLDYRDNPWWPQVLEEERAYMQRVDPDAYSWIWLGNCRTISDAQVLAGKYSIEEFTPEPLSRGADRRKDALASLGKHRELNALVEKERHETWQGPYFGCDWGYAADPTVLIKAWIYKRKLYVEAEAYRLKCDTSDVPELFDTVPGARDHIIRADSARPETISYMKQHGFPRMLSVKKWAGSVEDGVAFLRSFEKIILHPRCEHTATEFRLYSYKEDKLTGDVLPIFVDKHNHLVDSLRYALTPAIKQKRDARVTPWHLIA